MTLHLTLDVLARRQIVFQRQQKTFYPTPLASPSFLHERCCMHAAVASDASGRRALKPSQPIQRQHARRHAVPRGYSQLLVCAHTARMSDVTHMLDAGLPPDLLRGHYCDSSCACLSIHIYTTILMMEVGGAMRSRGDQHAAVEPDTYMPVQVLQYMTRCLQWYPAKPEIELVRQTCGAVGHCKSGSIMGLPRTYANLTVNVSTSRYTLLPQPTIACLLDWNVDASSTPDYRATIVQRSAF
jgi:hypothetical protein